MRKLLEDTYSGKRVFLTGHSGFKGSWLAFILNQLGAEVSGYALQPDESKNLFDLIRVQTFTKSVMADVRDRVRLEKEVVEFEPDFVFHLAAQSLVIRSYDDPALTYETNVMGTVNLLDALRKVDKACAAIFVTTDKVYENIEQEYPYRETDKLGGFDPYSSSKAAAEIAIASYRSSFFNPKTYGLHQKAIASARSGNVIGGGDWSANRILPDFIRSIERKGSLEIRNPHSVRPWQHVLDPLYGYLLLGVKLFEDPVKYSQAYNFGPTGGTFLTVEDVIKKAQKILGKGEYIFADKHGERHEAGLLHLDVTKATEELGWKPKLSADDAIRMALEWYRDYRIDPFAITFKQTNEYFNN